ncbi:MAG TPA: penicillin acylase family protein [Kofleriaceae bacterium]|nr:penicillin acylase family protein [Kofleriaceae bacterium]
MTRLLALPMVILMACGGSDDNPFDPLPLDETFSVGLGDPVHVARDRYGVAHIHGRSLGDVAFVQGYVMAHDRLPQMDILRRFGAGTLAEQFGALDASVINTDLEMRMHRMRPLAQESLDMLRASADPLDAEIVGMLERFADGVNEYAADLANGKWRLDTPLRLSFDPETFAPWSPVDSLVLGRFQAFALSFTAPLELELTDLYQKLRAKYPMSDPRAGVASDILTFKPVGLDPTIPGFPGGDTAADGSDVPATRTAGPAGLAGASVRPHVPDAVLAAARTAFATTIRTGARGALGPHAFMRPYAGSNNWAVDPELTKDGSAILATDQHLQLPNPSIFYPTHLIVDDGDKDREPSELDVIGVTFPGIPGVILGSNGTLAWSGTVSEHDVNDVYLETLVPCAQGSCVKSGTNVVPIETFTEEIRVGALGMITETFTATYERVPHHGPVLPEIDRTAHRLVRRPAGRAPMSLAYTGYQPTFEIRALTRMARAANVVEGFQALSDFTYGSQNWTMIDNSPDGPQIGWTTNAEVPLRMPAAYGWNARTRPDAAAPFFVLSGEGDHDWMGRMPAQYVPHARSPIAPEQHYLATANADPVGATFDNDPLNQRVVDGRPLYVGVAYAAGVRQERITSGIKDYMKNKPDGIRAEDMAALQHDTTSTVGAKLVPFLKAALGYVAMPVPSDAPQDVQQYVTGLAAADRDRLIAARTQLSGWAFATPTTQDALGSSAATAILNTWMHFFIEAALADELGAVSFDVWQLNDNQLFRIVYELLKADSVLSRSLTTGQPILCDDVAGSAADDSCTRLVLSAMVAAMQHLESPAGFGTADRAQWEWGRLHRLTIEPLFPNPVLNLPAPGETATKGFPKAGDNFVVNRADMGWRSLKFSQSADGPAQRFIAVARPGETITVRWQLPGGVIFDSRSPHYRDLLDLYYLPEQHFDAPYEVAAIVKDGEVRWEFE